MGACLRFVTLWGGIMWCGGEMVGIRRVGGVEDGKVILKSYLLSWIFFGLN